MESLKSAIALFDNDQYAQYAQIQADAAAVCDSFTHPYFRVAVFGPFNHGKSTLLNALLGDRSLPIDIVPTTGAAISIKYGEQTRTQVTFTDGTQKSEAGTKLLQQFSTLNSDRQMRGDIASIEVFHPHSLLKSGVELLDLPGTNDREAQDAFVHNQLLSADLVIQVLDARKLMTLGEREGLRDWLLDRGIRSVIFVVNFLNLMKPAERREVMNRARFVAESFRADLPVGVSNLYRVDALPALRQKLTGKRSTADDNGILALESTLEKLTAVQAAQRQQRRLGRIAAIAQQVQQILQEEAQALELELQRWEQECSVEAWNTKLTERRLKQGFDASVAALNKWLDLESLLQRYQAEASLALQQERFSEWESQTLWRSLNEHRKAMICWVEQACLEFDYPIPNELSLPLPPDPELDLPSPPSDTPAGGGSVVVGAIVGGFLGSLFGVPPIGAALGAGLANSMNQDLKEEWNSYTRQCTTAYSTAARRYLTAVHTQVLARVTCYQETVQDLFIAQAPEEPLDVVSNRVQLEALLTCLDNLDRELASSQCRYASV
jgi:hypothetical protein